MPTIRESLRQARLTLRRWRGGGPPRVAQTADLQAIVESLGPGDIAVDCGANIGKITEVLAWRGATVHAFEPNPFAFMALRRRFRFRSNIVCRQQAVGTEDGKAALFLHVNSDENPLYWSTGSSLLGEKGNVDSKRPIEIDMIDLDRFLSSLPGEVGVLKLDIEGAEVSVLERLIDNKSILRVRHVLVETHEDKIPSLVEPMRRLRQRVAKDGLTGIRFDWH